MNDMTDEEIALLVQRGNTDIFELLVDRYEEKMTRYARRFFSNGEDVKDQVQEVFIKAYVHMKSFNTNRRFSPWLYRVAHNEFMNVLKKKKRDPLLFFDFDLFFPHPFASQTADGELHNRELSQEMEDSLGILDAKYRDPLILYYYEDMDYRAIADILQIPISTVGVRMQRAKMQLKKIIASKNTESI
ncbi:MAG: RNA polymerase sigma factor [bacterium]|nr:RNA polymerase sigma factor [bacterium]